jgi:Tol biopolymer transport system component
VDHLAWFPDNLRLLLSGSEIDTLKPQLWVASVTGSPPYLLQDDARQGMPSPDGNHIAFTTGKDSGIWVESATGEEPQRVIAGQPNETFPVLLWSLDSKRLVYQRSHINSLSTDYREMLNHRLYSRSVAPGVVDRWRIGISTTLRITGTKVIGGGKVIITWITNRLKSARAR